MVKKKGNEIKPLDEDEYSNIEEVGFSDVDGLNEETISLSDGAMPDGATPIKIFSFNNNEDNSTSINNTLISHNNSKSTNEISNTNDGSDIYGEDSTNIPQYSKLRGKTPPVEDEEFSVKRCYQYRPSTLKKLNQLKGESDNFNIYLNEIVDQAICFYHDYVFNKK